MNNKGWIGVDIGTQSVKLVQVERSGGRIQLSEALVIRRREAWDDSTSAEPPVAESGEEVRAGLALGQGFTGRGAAVTLTMSLCDIRPLTIPDGSPGERRDVVARELTSLSGSVDGNREFDFWPIDLGADKQMSPENVLAASISRDWSQQVAKDLSAAHLVGNVLDVLPLALARAIEIGAPGSSRRPVAAVDWGYRRGTLCMVLDGCPMFVRCLRDAGFAAVIEALSRSLSVTEEEAQKLLTDHGLPSQTAGGTDELQSIIAEVAAQPLQTFAEELDRTITFLQQQRRSLVPEQVVLFGGGAAIRNIAPFLSDKLDIPISTWSLEGQSPPSNSKFPPLPLLGTAVALSALAWESL
jgi:Tfp pilus assembly PilM family ATPase